MATNADIILGALQVLSVVTEEQRAPSAAQGEYGMTVLNDMMQEWTAAGIDLEYPSQSTLTDTTPISETDRLTVKANLAVRMADTYNRPVPQLTAAIAQSGFDRLCRDAVLANHQTQDMSHLPLDQARLIRPSRILTG